MNDGHVCRRQIVRAPSKDGRRNAETIRFLILLKKLNRWSCFFNRCWRLHQSGRRQFGDYQIEQIGRDNRTKKWSRLRSSQMEIHRALHRTFGRAIHLNKTDRVNVLISSNNLPSAQFWSTQTDHRHDSPSNIRLAKLFIFDAHLEIVR